MAQPFFGIALEAALVLSNSVLLAETMLNDLAKKGYLHHYLATVGLTRSGSVALLILWLFGKGDPRQWPVNARQARAWVDGSVQEPFLKVVADVAAEFSQVQRLRSMSNDSPTIFKLREILRNYSPRSGGMQA
jgi:hypothetical protein